MLKESKMVEVIKTNVEMTEYSEMFIDQLIGHIPNGEINFDLEDCDRILRIEAESVSNQLIIEILHQNGYRAEVLI
jgi:hypothetical protein